MARYEIQIKDTKGKVIGYKWVRAPTAVYIVKNPSKFVGRGRRISDIYEDRRRIKKPVRKVKGFPRPTFRF